jgi:hypothetical protein
MEGAGLTKRRLKRDSVCIQLCDVMMRSVCFRTDAL